MTAWTLPRLSREWVGPITLINKLTNLPISTFEVAVVARGMQPVATDWTAPDLLTGQNGVLIGPGTLRVLPPGAYRLWVRTTAAPEMPVLSNVADVLIV